jgi:hypothetical protein
MAVLSLKKLFGTGGSDMQPQGEGNPSLLRKLLATLVGAAGAAAVPAWSAELTVTTHVVALATAGLVLAVDATTATAAGGKTIQSQATPAAGTVQVEYDAAGIPTLTFNATDAVTGAKVLQLGYSGDTVSVEA